MCEITYSKAQLYRQLESLQIPRGKTVLVHSSLKAVGNTEGRGEGLLEVLINHFTADDGLLCVPTHTWAFLLDKSKITLDMLSPATCIGTLPNLAANHPIAIRSAHPTHSMAVFGKEERARAFVKGEESLITPAHPSGCYGKIFDNGGYILLVGVEHNRNTFIHCVEEMLEVPNRISKTSITATIRSQDGIITQRQIFPHEAIGIGDVSLRYIKYEPAFRHHGAITDGYIGAAKVQICNARKMKEIIELIYQRSGGKELFSDYEPLDKSLYL